MAGCRASPGHCVPPIRLRRVSSAVLLFFLAFVFPTSTAAIGVKSAAGPHEGTGSSPGRLAGLSGEQEQRRLSTRRPSPIQPAGVSSQLTSSRVPVSLSSYAVSGSSTSRPLVLLSSPRTGLRSARTPRRVSSGDSPPGAPRQLVAPVKNRPTEAAQAEAARISGGQSDYDGSPVSSARLPHGTSSQPKQPAERRDSITGELRPKLSAPSPKIQGYGQASGVQKMGTLSERVADASRPTYSTADERGESPECLECFSGRRGTLGYLMKAGSESLKKAAAFLPSFRVSVEGTPQQEAVDKCFPRNAFVSVSSESAGPEDTSGTSVLREALLVQDADMVLYDGKRRKDTAEQPVTLQFFVQESSSFAEAPRHLQVQKAIGDRLKQNGPDGSDLLERMMFGSTYRMGAQLVRRVKDSRQRVSPLLQVLPAVRGSMSDLARFVATTTDTAMAANTCLAALVQTIGLVGSINQKGIVHGHLNADNIFIDATGQVKLGGFRFFHELGKAYLRLPGTPEFEAPEVVRSNKLSYGPALDSWSVGVVMYQVCCGRLPYGMRSTGPNPPYSKVLPILQILAKRSAMALDMSVCPEWVPTPVKNVLVKLLRPLQSVRLRVMRADESRAVGRAHNALREAEAAAGGQRGWDTRSADSGAKPGDRVL